MKLNSWYERGMKSGAAGLALALLAASSNAGAAEADESATVSAQNAADSEPTADTYRSPGGAYAGAGAS